MWTQGLNPEQVKAVQHNNGPLLILAGAGSGKTTVLVSRTGRLIAEGIAKPSEICVLTFTNKAARELKNRVQNKIGLQAKGLWAGTFHSFGLGLLKTYHEQVGLPRHFGVIDQSDSQAILRELLKNVRVVGKDKFDLEALSKLINQLRVLGRFPLGAQDQYHELAELLKDKYIKKLELLGVVDFEDLLLKPLALLKENPNILTKIQTQYQQVMVDEFQDTNDQQMSLIELMVKGHQNLTVVGDDDQSIYGWRGAQVANILDFPKHFKSCVTVRLERNYRSNSQILDVANNLITKNKKRHDKVLKAEAKVSGEMPELFTFSNEEDEAEFIGRELLAHLQSGYKPSDLAVLYRSNSQGAMIESILRRNNISYSVSGGTGFFDRKEIKDILAYLRLAFAPNDVAFRRIINTPTRGIGDTSLEKMLEVASQNKTSAYAVARAWRVHSLPEKLGHSLDQFWILIQNFIPRVLNDGLLAVLKDMGYRDYLFQTSSSSEAADKRWLMIDAFSRVLEAFIKKGGATPKTIEEFLEAMELRDDVKEESEEQVSLMTLHACKGLEFPIVYIIGIEEDILPHRTLGSDIDEERRLFYVGLTRAQNKLVLSRCQSRKRNGQSRPASPSRFLLEIAPNLVRDYKGEFRPVTQEQRGSLVSSFLAKLDQKISENPSASKKI